MSLYVDSAASRVCSRDITKRCWTSSLAWHIQGGSELPVAQGPRGGEGTEAISDLCLCGVESKF